jgi:hypothetical protein
VAGRRSSPAGPRRSLKPNAEGIPSILRHSSGFETSRLARLDPSPYGINSHLASADLLEKFAGIGVPWHRIDVDWPAFEPEDGVFSWAPLDALVRARARYGLSLLAVVAYTPRWASNNGKRSSPPREPELFQRFVRTFLERFPGEVHALSLWNEPDLPQFWSGSVQQYCDLIIPALAQIRASFPDVVLAGPDLSTWNRKWLEPILAATDEGPLLDVLAHHQYGAGDTVSGRVKEIEKLHEFLAQRTPTGRPLWVTEIGWNDGQAGQVSSPRQAQNLREVMAAMSSRPWWGKTFWYDSHGRVAGKPTAEWGLLGPDDSPRRGREKPAFRAYAEVTVGRGNRPDTVPESVARSWLEALYRGLLNRNPDDDAVGAYLESLRKGLVFSVCNALLASEEFTQRSAAPESLVGQIYRSLLHRDPDPDGQAQGLEEIGAGRVSAWLVGLLESDEFRERRA